MNVDDLRKAILVLERMEMQMREHSSWNGSYEHHSLKATLGLLSRVLSRNTLIRHDVSTSSRIPE